KAFPEHVLVAPVMAGSGTDPDLRHWQELALACQQQGFDALELNLPCPHTDRPDMGSNDGQDQELVSSVPHVVPEGAPSPACAKRTRDGPAWTMSLGCGATGSSRSRRSGGRLRRIIAVATRRRATRRRSWGSRADARSEPILGKPRPRRCARLRHVRPTRRI